MKKIKRMITIIVVVAINLSYTANAQVTYTSVNTGNWSVSNTWNPNGIPTASDDVIISSGHTVTVQSGTDAKANNVTVNGILNVLGTLNQVFSCGEDLVDTRDGKSYATVQIGTQCWMAENLNIGTMINGSGNQTDNSTIEKYCYSNNTANCDVYGGLYQWDEMMQYVTTEGTQGICPTGWHLPTDAEWMTLEEKVESITGVNWNTTGWRGTDAGGNLKETGTTHWSSPNTGATNSSGFTGLPGGYCDSGGFYNLGDSNSWWSSTENSSTNAWNRYLRHDNDKVHRGIDVKMRGFSVRCVRD